MSEDDWWCSLAAAMAVGSPLVNTLHEFDLACDHIVRLLTDSSLLLRGASHATACFLAITALEEIAKTYLSVYRKSNSPIPRRQDPLFRHDEKHCIAAAPSIAMGSRLQAAIGEKSMKLLIDMARGGELVRLREAALYVDNTDGNLCLPSHSISPALARELLLFSIEAFDDALVGFTDHSRQLRERMNHLFSEWATC